MIRTHPRLGLTPHLRREVEPRVVDIARTRGATWEQIAPHVGVADRRAAQARRRRQGPEGVSAGA